MYRSIEDPLDDHSIQNTEDKIHTNCKTRIHAFLRTNWLWLLLLVGLSFGFSYIFTLPYCGWLFQCGCTWVWAGGVKNCNIFQPNSPHCPWCVTHVILSNIPLWGTPFLMIFVTATLSFYFPRHRLIIYGLVPMTLWAVFNLFYGLIFKVAYHYPHFIVQNVSW